MFKYYVMVAITLLTSCASANQIEVFGGTLAIESGCVVTVSANKREQKFTPKFTPSGECRLMTHSNTNVVKTMFISGMYVFFIENNISKDSGCTSEYSAFGVSSELDLFTTVMVKKSLSCFQEQEEHSYEYFSKKLSKLEKANS